MVLIWMDVFGAGGKRGKGVTHSLTDPLYYQPHPTGMYVYQSTAWR